VGTRTPDLYRVKAALLCTANNLKGVGGCLSTAKLELLQVELQVKNRGALWMKDFSCPEQRKWVYTWCHF